MNNKEAEKLQKIFGRVEEMGKASIKAGKIIVGIWEIIEDYKLNNIGLETAYVELEQIITGFLC